MTCFEENRTQLGNDTPMSGALVIGSNPLVSLDLVPVELNTSNQPFFEDTPKIPIVPLLAKGCSMGTEISKCSHCFLPYISKYKVEVSLILLYNSVGSCFKTDHP